jgi:hypothetical protein
VIGLVGKTFICKYFLSGLFGTPGKGDAVGQIVVPMTKKPVKKWSLVIDKISSILNLSS